MRGAVDAASDLRFANLRRFRNTLYLAALGLAAVLALLALDYPGEQFLAICPPPPTNEDATPTGSTASTSTSGAQMSAEQECAEVWQVQLVGSLGGLLAAIVALSRYPVSTEPYGVRIAQAILKVPAGAAFALMGTMLLQSKAIDALEAQELPALFAYVVVFGYAQQAVTRLIDRKGKALTSETDETDAASKESEEQ